MQQLLLVLLAVNATTKSALQKHVFAHPVILVMLLLLGSKRSCYCILFLLNSKQLLCQSLC